MKNLYRKTPIALALMLAAPLAWSNPPTVANPQSDAAWQGQHDPGRMPHAQAGQIDPRQPTDNRYGMQTDQRQAMENQPQHTVGEDHPDAWLIGKVKARLAMDEGLEASEINVAAQAGVVELTGRVDSQAKAIEATRLAQTTEGVVLVNSRLVVEQTPVADSRYPLLVGDPDIERRDNRPEAATLNRPDAWVLTKVKAKMMADDTVGAVDIDVEVDEGVVVLDGLVASQAEEQAAIRLAHSIEGVQRVVSTLRIRN